MASTLKFVRALTEKTANELSTLHGNWRRFLDASAQLYKYSFPDQMLIYAQKPDAVAVAEIELWNEKFDRFVKRGTKGIALIDDTGSYQRLKYVFDVNDTYSLRHNAKPVQLWEMKSEHKDAVIAELVKNYEDIDESDSLADAFRSIARQLAAEYYSDNVHDIQYRAEDSVLAPQALYDSDGMPFDERDGTFLESTFIETLTNSIAYTVMSRCGLDTENEFEDSDFQAIADFNTTDMVFAIGTATSELSEQVLRDVEIVIRKYERVKTAQVERSEQDYDRNPYLQPSGRLSSSRPQADRADDGGTPWHLRQNEESVSERTQDNQLQPPVTDRETVPAPERSGAGGEPQARTGDEPVDGADEIARQGDRPARLDGGDEHAAVASRGNGDERTDLRIEQPEQGAIPAGGAAEQAAPFSMAEQAQHHVRWNELIIDAVVHDETILNAAVNSDKENTITEIESLLKRLHLAIKQDIIDSAMSNKNGAINELDAYFTRDRNPPITEQLYDSVIRSDQYKARLAQNETPSEQEVSVADGVSTPLENSRASIGDILKGSSIRLYEVDAILRDGGNYDNHKLHNIPYNSRSSLRIAAHLAKNRDDNDLFLQREYLRGLYGRKDAPSGKGFNFEGAPGVSSHHVCAWFDENGISLAIGTTAKNNIHKITIPWDVAADRIKELYDAGQYVTPDTLSDALDNETRELAGSLWDFYRDDMGGIPDEWNAKTGGYPEDVAIIKGLLDNSETRQTLIDRVKADIAAYNPEEHERHWHNRHRLLYDTLAVGHAPAYPPQAVIDSKPFKYFITQDEIDARLTQGTSFSEGKFRTLSFFLNHADEKDRITFLKEAYGTGGGTWSAGNGQENHTPGDGITLGRGDIFTPDAEVNLKWNAVARRIDTLIHGGLYMSRSELDSLQSYEKLILARNINSFYYELPEEYTRPLSKELDFFYPHENEWNALNDLLNDGERLDAAISQMQYIFDNTPDNDRFYNTRKNALERLTEFRDGTYTLFPGVENLTSPEAAAERQISPTRRDNGVVINLSDSGDDRFGEPPASTAQMTLFDMMEQSLPILPSALEQQQKIDQSLQKEAAEIKAASDILENDIDNVLLNISDEDKARLYEQFADNPRSRTAVNLAKEIYGSALPFPLPQAIKRLGELAESGRLDGIGDPYNLFDRVRDELLERGYVVSGEIVEDGINEFRSQVGHGDFADVADYIENEFLSDEHDVEYAVAEPEAAPKNVLDAIREIKDSQGNPIVMWQVGDFYEMYGDDAVNSAAALTVSMTERRRDVPVPYLVTGIPGNKLDEYRQKLTDAGYSVAVSSVGEGSERNFVLYKVETQPAIAAEQSETESSWKYDLLSDKAVYLEDGKVGYPRYSYLGGLQIGVIIADEQGREHEREYSRKLLESELDKDSRNDYLLITPRQQTNYNRTDADPVTIEEKPFDFDAIAEEIYEQVLNDGEFREVLDNATSCGALRRPLNGALDAVIAGYESETRMFEYLSNDDIADSLFDFIYRKAWDEREQESEKTVESQSKVETDVPTDADDEKPPRYEVTQTSDAFPDPEDAYAIWDNETNSYYYNIDDRIVTFPEEWQAQEFLQTLDSAFGTFTEITDPAELAEIEAIFGGAKEPEQAVKPLESYVAGIRIVLDAWETYKNPASGLDETDFTGEFIIDEVSADYVTVSKGELQLHLTREEIAKYTVDPVIEQLYREPDTAYYLLRYPEGIEAGAAFGVDEMKLITEYSKHYVICADACYLSAEDLERYNITFRKMPRDWNLLPSDVQAKIRNFKPEYETQWQESSLSNLETLFPSRYDIKPVTIVEEISSNPRRVSLLEKGDNGRRYGVWDNQKENLSGSIGGYLKNPDESYIFFKTEPEAAAYIEKLNAELDVGTQSSLAQYTPEPLRITLPPLFVVDWEQAQHDFDLSLYRDRDIIAYDKNGVQHALGRSGNITYVTSTGMLFGGNEVPGNIYEQIEAYKNGDVTDEQVRDNYIKAINEFKEYRAEDISKISDDVLTVMSDGLFAGADKDQILNLFHNKATNSEIHAYLAENWQKDGNVKLTNGYTADFVAFEYGLSIVLDDAEKTNLSKSWDETVRILRALEPVWLAERKAERDTPVTEQKDVTNLTQLSAPEIPVLARSNFRITDDHLGEGGAKTKYRANIEAIRIIRDIEQRGYNATADEQDKLSRYVGWGGLPQAFDENNKDWANEYAELKGLLTPDEYDMARASTLNAHYTSPVVIKSMWETIGRLGFKSGNVLEPSMGIGNFFGLLPQEMWQSKLYGVELDSMTAQIAKQLYPKANIQQIGYEKSEFSDAFFDVAIGNVPFGGYQVADARYKQGFPIHDYFFQKTIDKVRPGGVVAFVTSKFTLDKQNPEARKYIAQRAELLGAVRLPNNAFLKNAGTETTMDILFLQKRDRPIDIEPDWVHLGKTEDGIPVNRYFLDNPEMVLGVMGLDEHMNNKYGRDDYTACLPIEGADLSEQLKTALLYIQGEYTVDELDDLDGVDNHAIPADYSVKNFSYTEVDGTVYFRENSLMYPVDLPATTLDRIRGMIGLRGCVGELIALQLDDYGEDEIKAKQAELSDLYDSFIAEYGLINSTANYRAFNADSAYYLLCSLEVINEDGELARKADMFTKRTIKKKTVITHVDTASEALAVSLGERARVDLGYMSELTGFSEDKLKEDLQGVIYLNIGSAESQEKTYVTADEYLSGNIRKKLEAAEAAAATVPSLQINVDALKAVMPVDLEAEEISVRLGSTWIAPEYVQQFMYELLDTNWRNRNVYQVKYHQYTGEWQVTGKGKSQFSDIPATVTYGTGRMNAYQIIDDTLNLRDVRVYDYKEDADGKERRVLNKKETMLAQQKQELIKQKFKDWIWQDPKRRQTLVQKYNELFNSVRTREYDGSHITFGGISPEIELKPHQLNAIAHIMYGGNTLLAHVVGAGKTFEMTAAAMESKRLGLCHKSLFAVPNHLTEQWASEFLRLYPSANILVATKKDFEMRNRKKFCAKIATGDYDAVIIGHSQLEKIPMSRERQERLLNEQIWEVEQGIKELKEANGERYSIKNLEKTKRNLETRLSKLLDSKRRDDVVTFEQLGVDRLYVDEAHNFKELCYRGSFGKGTLLYSATALFAVHSEDCNNKEKGDRVYDLSCRSIHAGIVSQT